MRKSLFAVPAVALLSLGLLPVTAAGAQETSVSDGIYEVRRDVQPGNYRTDGPTEPDGSCYYARLSGNTGTLEEVLANGNTSGPASLTVNWDDKYVQFSGGCTWAIDGDPGPTAPAPAPAPATSEAPDSSAPAPAPAPAPEDEDEDEDAAVPNMDEGMATGGFEIK